MSASIRSIRLSSTAIEWLLAIVLVVAGVGVSRAQNLHRYYVSKAEPEGTIYHTFPCTLFECEQTGDLTFDVTYREHADGRATINFTCVMPEAAPADSIGFVAGGTRFTVPVERLYLESGRRDWTHRYTCRVEVGCIGRFFDKEAEPTVTLHADGHAYLYRVKRSAWRSYAPVGARIFEVIRVNEAR